MSEKDVLIHEEKADGENKETSILSGSGEVVLFDPDGRIAKPESFISNPGDTPVRRFQGSVFAPDSASTDILWGGDRISDIPLADLTHYLVTGEYLVVGADGTRATGRIGLKIEVVQPAGGSIGVLVGGEGPGYIWEKYESDFVFSFTASLNSAAPSFDLGIVNTSGQACKATVRLELLGLWYEIAGGS